MVEKNRSVNRMLAGALGLSSILVCSGALAQGAPDAPVPAPLPPAPPAGPPPGAQPAPPPAGPPGGAPPPGPMPAPPGPPSAQPGAQPLPPGPPVQPQPAPAPPPGNPNLGVYPGSFYPPPIPPPPPPPVPRQGRGVTDKGIPLGHRGGLTLDTAAFGDGDGDAAGGTINVVGSYPLAKRLFFDARLPLGISAPRNANVALFAMGNPNLGVHGDIQANKSFWVTLGGGLGLPVANARSQDEQVLELPPVPHGGWNMHDFYPNAVPLSFETLFEGHISALILRLEVDPVVYIPYEPNDEPEFVLQHAGELQIGHSIGGGLRIQGVAVPTGDNFAFSYFDGDFYQLAIEPFFAVEDELLFARVGILLPMDGELGPPFEQSWGFRFKTGVHID